MEWRIRTEKRMNAAEDKATLSGAYKLERHLPERAPKDERTG